MTDYFISLMEVFAAIFSLLISMGGVMTIDAVGTLSDKIVKLWEIHQKYPDVNMVPYENNEKKMELKKSQLRYAWWGILFFGIIGVFNSLFAIYLSSKASNRLDFILNINASILIIQFSLFFFSSKSALDAFDIKIMRPPANSVREKN